MDNISPEFITLIYLLNCAINREEVDIQKIKHTDFDNLLKISKEHKIVALVEVALESYFENNEILSDVQVKKWKSEYSKVIMINMLFDNERKKILDSLEKNEIWYMPMKGFILSELYPRYGLRQMGDIDILVDSNRVKDIRDIMNNNGYETDSYGEIHHDSYKKKPFYTFEMHRILLFTGNKVVREYYENVKERLIKVDNKNYEYRFTDEDFYIFFIVHSLKHLKNMGTGIRTLVDIYLYINKKDLDFGYIETELKKLNMFIEEKIMRNLSKKIFSIDFIKIFPKLNDTERNMLNKILYSGVYGSFEYGVKNKLSDISGKNIKLKYIIKRIFVIPTIYSVTHPFLYNHKITRPVLFYIRLHKGLTKSRKRLIKEWKILKNFCI